MTVFGQEMKSKWSLYSLPKLTKHSDTAEFGFIWITEIQWIWHKTNVVFVFYNIPAEGTVVWGCCKSGNIKAVVRKWHVVDQPNVWAAVNSAGRDRRTDCRSCHHWNTFTGVQFWRIEQTLQTEMLKELKTYFLLTSFSMEHQMITNFKFKGTNYLHMIETVIAYVIWATLKVMNY